MIQLLCIKRRGSVLFLDNFILIAQQVLVLFILIAVGFACGKAGMLTEHASKKMTDVVLYIVTPCVMVNAFQREFSVELLGQVFLAAGIAALILALSIVLVKLVFHDKNVARKKVLQFAVVFSNCGFMSLPLQKQLLGDDGWFFGSIFVAMFNIIVWTYGLVDMSGDKKQLSIKKIALNPGIIGAVAAIILFVLPFQLPPIIAQPITHLSNLNTPVPMLIIGYYLSKANFRKAFTDGGAYLASLFRLIIIPFAAAFAMLALHLDKTMVIAFTIASAAPTAATTTMFAAKFNRDVELSVSVVTLTTVLSLVTMPLIVSIIWSIA